MLVTGCVLAGVMAPLSITTENRSECSGELPMYPCKRRTARPENQFLRAARAQLFATVKPTEKKFELSQLSKNPDMKLKSGSCKEMTPDKGCRWSVSCLRENKFGDHQQPRRMELISSERQFDSGLSPSTTTDIGTEYTCDRAPRSSHVRCATAAVSRRQQKTEGIEMFQRNSSDNITRKSASCKRTIFEVECKLSQKE